MPRVVARRAHARPRTPASQALASALLAGAVAVPLAAGAGGALGAAPAVVAAADVVSGPPAPTGLPDDRAARQEAARSQREAQVQAQAQQAAEQAAQQAAAARAAEVAAAEQRASRSSSGDPRSIARSMLAARGLAGQFSCLEQLWQRESNWSVTATNRSSGAYGIPQSLPATKMASAGEDWRTNAATQIRWGLDYIAATYGTPCGAWRQSQARGWY